MIDPIICSINIRLTKKKPYYTAQLKQFCSYFDNKKLIAIQFGKQDIRGTESITFVNNKQCVPAQKHFFNKLELLGFVVGFNSAMEKGGYDFSQFFKGCKK